MEKQAKKITSDFHIHKRTLSHWQSGGHSYFVTFRSAIGELPPKALVEFKKIVLEGHRKKYELLFGVIMPDHVHLLIKPLEKGGGVWHDLAEIMKGIKGASARKINIVLGRLGTVWQNEYFDRMIRDENEMIEKFDYMWNNPLKKGLADSIEEYIFYVRPEEKSEPNQIDGLKSVPLIQDLN